MSREHEQKPSDRDPNTQITTSEPTVDTGPNLQAGQMMGLDPDVQVQSHASGGGNAQVGQMEGLLEGTSLDVRPRKHRALVNGIPVKDHVPAELDVYSIEKPLVVSIDTQRGDGRWQHESVHELTVHWDLMKGHEGE